MGSYVAQHRGRAVVGPARVNSAWSGNMASQKENRLWESNGAPLFEMILLGEMGHSKMGTVYRAMIWHGKRR